MLREALKKLQLQCHCPYQVDGRDGQNPYYEATNYRDLQLWVEGGGSPKLYFPTMISCLLLTPQSVNFFVLYYFHASCSLLLLVANLVNCFHVC